jgi:hypothetical protein
MSAGSGVAATHTAGDRAVAGRTGVARVINSADNNPIPGALVDDGGPVQTAPRLYLVFWDWSSDPDGEQPYLIRFLSSIGGSPWLQTLSQYGAGTDPKYEGDWSDTTDVTPTEPTDAQIQAEAKLGAKHFGITDSVNDQVIVAMAPGVGLKKSLEPDDTCAYHGPIKTELDLTYTALPYLPTYALNCGQNYLHNELDAVSMVEGHEMAESITDPLVNVQTAWVDAGGNEVADKCAYYDVADTITSQGTFAVQPLWSNSANECALGPPYSWVNQQIAAGNTSSAGPSIAVSGQEIYAAFKGHTSDHVLYMTNGGTGWSGNSDVDGGNADTVFSPAITIVDGTPYVAWTDASTGDVDVSSLGSNGVWSTPVVTGNGTAKSSNAPAICADGSSVYIVFKGYSSDDVYITANTSSSWSPLLSIPGASTPDNPAVSCDQDEGGEFIAWTTSSGTIDGTTDVGSTFPYGVDTLPGITNDGPALGYSETNGGLYVSWKGDTTDKVFYSYPNGSGGFYPQQTVTKALTLDTPAIAWETSSTMYAFWTGETSDSIYYSASNNP